MAKMHPTTMPEMRYWTTSSVGDGDGLGSQDGGQRLGDALDGPAVRHHALGGGDVGLDDADLRVPAHRGGEDDEEAAADVRGQVGGEVHHQRAVVVRPEVLDGGRVGGVALP